jgi:hypothetical protein
MSRALFSLATGLEIAVGQSGLEAVERAKLASVLFDEVVIESGLHVVEMSADEPSMIRRLSAKHICLDMLEHSRTVERGAKVGLAIRTTDADTELYVGTDLPRLEDAVYFEREVAFRYVSEYHSNLLNELAHLGADWVSVIEINRSKSGSEVAACSLGTLPSQRPGALPFSKVRINPDAAQQLIDELAKADRRDSSHSNTSVTEAAPHELMLAEDLREAVSVGRQLDAIPAVSMAFRQVALERGVSIRMPGAESLGFLVPNFSHLPWEAIARFRDHPGAVEARGRLREFESAATASDAGDALTQKTGQAVTEALLAVTKDLSPKLPDELRGPITASTVGLVPIVGQYASLAVSMGDIISALSRHQAYEGSWVAAILDLRNEAIDDLVDW